MVLSPWLVAPDMDYGEVACILGGYDPAEASELIKHGPEFEYQIADVYEWKRQMLKAVGRGDLKAELILLYGYSPHGDRSEKTWFRGDTEDILLGVFPHNEVKMQLQRPEVNRWLKASGIDDVDIPLQLRSMPLLPEPGKHEGPNSASSPPLHHRRRQTYLTLIEALALEALGGEIPTEPYKAASMLQVLLERHGLRLDKDPIANTVKEIHAAREDRDSEKA